MSGLGGTQHETLPHCSGVAPNPPSIAAGWRVLSVHGSRAAQNPHAWQQGSPAAFGQRHKHRVRRSSQAGPWPCNAPLQQDGHRSLLQRARALIARLPSSPSGPPRFDATSGRWKAVGDRWEQPSLGMSLAPWSGATGSPKTLAQAAVPAGLGSVPVPQAAASSCRTFAGQHEGMETKLLPAMPLVLKNPGCSSGCRSSGKDACSVQATATAGRREGDGVPGWQVGRGTGQGGRRHDNDGGEVWRRMVGGFLRENASGSAGSGFPSRPAHTASLHRPLSSCPRRAPAPATRVLLPSARGGGSPGSHPGATGDGLPWGGAAVAALAGARIAAAAQRGGAVGVPPGGRGAPGGREKRLCLRPSG